MYYFKGISDKDKALIEEGIRVLKEFNVPVSDEAIFIYCHGISRFGWCGKDKQHKFRIAINEDIVSDEEKISTVIHELLHTIPNDGYSMHRGQWKYWAEIISKNTQYKITASVEESKFYKMLKMDNEPTVICECPICHDKRRILERYFYYSPYQYFCRKCHKILYSVLPDSPLKNMSESERKAFVNQELKRDLSQEEIFNYVVYTDLEDTRKLTRYCLKKYPHNNELHFNLNKYGCIDKKLKEELAKEYINGDWDKYIHSLEERMNFEGFFACTKWYIPAVEHGDEVFGQILI